MKKIGILLAILLIAGVCAMADETVTIQDYLLFADIDAVALSTVEMEAVDGGQLPDMDGSYGGYGPYDKIQERDMSTRPTKSQYKESAHSAVDAAFDFPKSVVDWAKEGVRFGLHRMIDRM